MVRSSQLHQVGWSLCSISFIVVLARCYCRKYALDRFGWDDGFMVLTMCASIACVSLVSAGARHGFGLHLADITDPYSREQAVKFAFLAPAVSIIASTLGKISTVLFLMRLLGGSAKRRQKWFLYSITSIMVALNIFIVGILFGQCTPMQKIWRQDVPGRCLSPQIIDYGGRTQSVWNAIMDLVNAGFPAYMIWKLQIKKSTKWGLTFLMGGGVFAATATFVKVYYMRDVSQLADVTHAWAPIAIWYMAEIFVLIITGSLPTLRPLLSQIRGRLPSSGDTGNSRRYLENAGGLHKPYAQSQSGNLQQMIGSKSSRGGGRSTPGDVTVALNEIDNIITHEAGSSTDSILRNDDSRRVQETPGAIYVQKKVQVNYSQRR
ncbi:hypothetical protein DM02DRAFT_693287 [Periconia macrospinosa]|uniref:Rhodopsin domain-containing protein n=1 Tax=Periconia macrospinosa TaxID=97972 RepID=A0A2V1E1U7_9PLEO|nr:hypothetical protein DM02DRAFT_693287 [Periconia macrospinosa]